MKISQSIIKDVLPGNCCKYYFDYKYIQNRRTEPTAAMQKGLLFETLLLGTARDGAFIPPKKKDGTDYTWVTPIVDVAELGKRVLDKAGIVIDNVQAHIETNDLDGHIDFMSDRIYDVKFTGESWDRWDYSFRKELHEQMRIQANHYQLIEGNQKDVLFLIFSEHGWYRGILYPYSEYEIELHRAKIERTKELIGELNQPSNLTCCTCPFASDCPNRVIDLTIENVDELIIY